MRTSIKTPPKTLMKMLAVAGIAGSCVLTSSLTFAQSAQQRPAPGSGMAVDGGTAGVVVNNYNSNYNTVTVSK